jgi:hypothetical protein
MASRSRDSGQESKTLAKGELFDAVFIEINNEEIIPLTN